MHNLLKDCQIDWVDDVEAAGSSIDSNSARLDMANWDGVLFVTPIKDSAATGVGTLKVEENSSDADSGMTLIAGASAAATCAVNDDLNNKLLIVDVYRPQERYVQAVRTSATANIAFGDVFAFRYKGRKAPFTQDTSTVAASTFVVGS